MTQKKLSGMPSLEAVLDSMSDSFSVIDRDWRIVYVNPVAAATLGQLQKTDILGKNVWDEFPEFVGTEAYARYHEVMEHGKPQSFEIYYEPLDLFSRSNVYPFDGGIAIFSQDVSALRRAERSARDEAEKLKLATSAAGVGMWDYYPREERLHWDEQCKRIFGLDPAEDVTYDRFLELLHPDDRDVVQEAVTQAFDPNLRSKFEMEYRILRKDGKLTHAVARGRALFSDEGGGIATRFIGTLIDVTARKQQQLEIEDQRERLRVTMQSIGDAVITTDTAGNVTYLNPVAEKLTGWTLTDASGKPLSQVFKIINEVTHEVQENPVARVLEHGITVGLANHTVLISKNGEESPIEDSAAPIRDASGEIIGVVLVFHDATESRKAEEVLKRSNRRISRILEGIGEGFTSFDREWNITFANEKAQEILASLKGEPVDLSGRNMWSEFPDLIWSELYEKFQEASRTMLPIEFSSSLGSTNETYSIRAFPSLEGLSVFFNKKVA
jgi:PAS domain S-box-containing protein